MAIDKTDETKEKALEMLKNSQNWVLIAEISNLNIKEDGQGINMASMGMSSHLWGINESETHTFIICLRQVEDTLLAALVGKQISIRQMGDKHGKGTDED